MGKLKIELSIVGSSKQELLDHLKSWVIDKIHDGCSFGDLLAENTGQIGSWRAAYKEQYYALWDNDTHRYMRTGLNDRSMEAIKKSIIAYASPDDIGDGSKKDWNTFLAMDAEGMAEMFNLRIDSSDEPFER